MRRRFPIPLAASFAILVGAGSSPAQEDLPSIEGRVVDAEGEPVPGARVSIATAAVRRGVSPY